MMKRLSDSFLLTTMSAVLLSACGGGDMVPESTSLPPASSLAFSSAPLSSEPIVRGPQRLAAQVQPGMGSINAEDFMNWVQQALPAAFPGPQSSASAVANGISYTYRYYPLANGGWNVVAVTSDSKVYAIGDSTHGALVQFGVLSDYLCGVNPGRCVASTYAIGTIEAKHFAELNDARIKGGFGALAQDAHLDQAALNHVAYFEAQYYKPYYYTADDKLLPYTGVEPLNPAHANPIVYLFTAAAEVDSATGVLKAHVETLGQAGFTGVLPVNRANAAGYAGGTARYVGEVIGSDNPLYALDRGCVDELLTSVFHRGAMLDPGMVDVGLGIKTTFDGYNRVCIMNFANARGQAAPLPLHWMGIYPGDGAANVSRSIRGELPNPVPEFAVQGNPASVFVTPGHTLTVSSFTMTGPENAAVPVKLLMAKDFPGYIGGHQAYIVPNGALAPNSTYTVTFVGADNGTALTKTWRFTTTPLVCDQFGCW